MKKLLLLLIVITVTSISIFGQTIPKQISYQGVLKDALGNLVNGDQALTFKIYNDPTGGTTLWTEIQVINVTNGLFIAHLGANTPITGVPFDRLHFLGITIGSEPELSPRTLLTPTPYSFMAMDIMDNTVVKSINSIKDNVNLVAGSNITITPSGNNLTISATGGGGGTVTQVNTGAGLTGGPITTTGTISVANDGITSSMLQNNSVTSAKIVDGTITAADIGATQVVKGLNSLKDNVNLVAGSNITITPSGQNITISSTAGGVGGSGTTNYIPRFTAATTLGNSAIYQSTANNIGIGTTTPGSKLTIVGDVFIPTTGSYFIGTNTNSGNRIRLHYNNSLALATIDYYPELQIRYNETAILTLKQSGLVGIGTTSPTAQLHALHVSGTYGRIATSLDGVNAYTNVTNGFALYAVKGTAAQYAGYFSGAVHVAGALSKASGSFKIDHPLDPANKYLYHSFVESPDMMNIYNGNIVTDGSGYATITLPEWFEALNKDFRYQLTVIGDFAQAIIAQKVQNNQFAIRTDKANVEVSWQVTGIRKDAWAEKNRIPIEESKKGHEVGRYIYPEVYGLPETMSIEYERNKLESEKIPE